MPSCNLCDTDTTGSRRVSGKCYSCTWGSNRWVPEDGCTCIFCGERMNNRHYIGIIKTKKGDSHTVCSCCWADLNGNKDKIPEKRIPKTSCRHCDNQILQHGRMSSCEFCLESRNLSICPCCSLEVDEIISKLDGRNMCKFCVTKFYFICINCSTECYSGSSTASHYRLSNRNNTHKICNSCSDNYEGEILGYNYKPDPLKYQPPWINISDEDYKGVHNRGRKLVYLGVEVELLCDKHYAPMVAREVKKLSKKRVYNKRDSSIPTGFEMVSHPMILEYHEQKKDKYGKEINPELHMNWQQIFKYLISKGCLSHNTTNCGLHIHVNKSFLSKTEQNKLNVFINSHMNEVSKIARRNTERFARYKKLEKEDFLGEITMGRNALNFSNSNSIEFRMFKGTLKHSTFIATLQFVDACVRFIKEVNWKDLFDLEYSWKLFVVFVKENKYSELLKYMRSKKVIQPHVSERKSIDRFIRTVNLLEIEPFDEEEVSGECV